MCYYSTTLHSSQFRAVKAGEDLTLMRDGQGHTIPVGKDRRVVCIAGGTEVHFENLRFTDRAMWAGMEDHVTRYHHDLVDDLMGPQSGKFVEYHGHRYSADFIKIGEVHIHLSYLAPGTTFYTGPKKGVPLETKLGVDDPSIIHDHRAIDEMPTARRTKDRLTFCSVTR